MAALVFDTEETFETGDIVCIDSPTGKATLYDSLRSIVGVAFRPLPETDVNGRQWFNINGLPYYFQSEYVYSEDFTTDYTLRTPAPEPFNPLNSKGKIAVITQGIAPIKNSEVPNVPLAWVELKEGDAYTFYLVR